MRTKLISPASQEAIGFGYEARANPNVIGEIKTDVLADLMSSPHAIERPKGRKMLGAHTRHRTCV
jgi:hypothetical protein